MKCNENNIDNKINDDSNVINSRILIAKKIFLHLDSQKIRCRVAQKTCVEKMEEGLLREDT